MTDMPRAQSRSIKWLMERAETALNAGNGALNDLNNDIKPKVSDNRDCVSELGEISSNAFEMIMELAEIVSSQAEEIEELKRKVGELNVQNEQSLL